MIKGNRLLLALDVIAFRGGLGTDRQFSTDRIDAVLLRLGWERDLEIAESCGSAAVVLEPLRAFLKDNARVARGRDYNVYRVLAHLADEVVYGGRHLVGLVTAIGTDALTESDFR